MVREQFEANFSRELRWALVVEIEGGGWEWIAMVVLEIDNDLTVTSGSARTTQRRLSGSCPLQWSLKVVASRRNHHLHCTVVLSSVVMSSVGRACGHSWHL